MRDEVVSLWDPSIFLRVQDTFSDEDYTPVDTIMIRTVAATRTRPRSWKKRLWCPSCLCSVWAMLAMPILLTFVVLACVVHTTTHKRARRGTVLHQQGIDGGGRHEEEDLPPTSMFSQDTQSFLAEMARRSDAMRNACLMEPSEVTLGATASHFAADTKDGFLYCVVPQPPSKTWLATQLQEGGLWSPRLDEQGGVIRNPNALPQHFNLEQQENLFHARFLVTRHPLQRLLDCYTTKFENGRDSYYYNKYSKEMVFNYRERSYDMSASEVSELLTRVDEDPVREQTLGNLYANPIGPTFTEFVLYVVNATYSDDVLWRPIHEHCVPCSINYNYILSFENLDEEGDLLMQVMGVPPSDKPKRQKSIVGHISEEATCSYYSQLSSQLMQELLTKYNFELLVFEYLTDLYDECENDYVRQ